MLEEGQASTSTNGEKKALFIKRNGGLVLLSNGYQYTKKKGYKNGSSLWRCVNARSKCSGHASVDKNNTITNEREHQCKRIKIDDAIVSLREMREKMLSTEFSTISRISNDQIIKINNKLGISNSSSSEGAVSSVTDINKEVVKPEVVNPEMDDKIEIPTLLKEFVLSDYVNKSLDIHIIIFGNKKILGQVKNFKNYYGNGTSKCIPKPFFRFYTIYGEINRNDDDTEIIPLIYALLNAVDDKSYEIFFKLLKDNIPDWKPLKYVTDAEQSVMDAISNIFPTVEIKICHNHFSQCICKKAKELDLNKNQVFRKHVALTILLPLLPREYISEGWNYIKNDGRNSNEIQKFNKYIETQWLKDEDFVDRLCAHNQNRSTHNAMKAWLNELNNCLPRNPNLCHVMKALIHDSNLQMERLNDCNTEKPKSKRRFTEEIAIAKFIDRVVGELLAGKITVGHCLEKMRL